MTDGSGMEMRSQVRKLARNAVSLAVGGVVAQLAFTLLEILVARKLGAAAFGAFVTAYAYTVLASFFMEVGTPLYTIQEGSRRHERLPGLLGSALTINVTVFTLLYAGLAVASVLFPANTVLHLLLIVLPYGLILTLQNNLAAVYSSYQTMQVNAVFQGLAPVAVLLVYFAFAARGLTLDDVGYAYVIGGAVVTGAWLAYTVRRVRPATDLAAVRRTLRSSYQYGLTGVLGQVFFKADVVLLTALAGVREAGIYAAAFKLVDLVFKVAVLSGRVFAPAIFKASHEPGKSFDVFASMMTRFLAVTGLLAGLVSFVLADDLIAVMFGDEYSGSIPVLRILGGVMAAKCMMVSMQLLLSSIDLHFQRVKSLSLTVLIHIGACFLLIPHYGAIGAAIATLFSGSLLIVLYAWASFRRGRFHFVRWLLVPSCLAAVIGTGTVFADLHAFPSLVAAVGAFLLTLLLTGFVRRHEIKFVFRSVLGGGERSGT